MLWAACLMWLFLSVFVSPCCCIATPRKKSELEVLLLLRDALDPGGRVLGGSWQPHGDPCDTGSGFLGVECDAHGRVSRLRLDRRRLLGVVPGEIAGLTQLQVVNLSHNSLTGPIPLEIVSLQQLRAVDLSYNHLWGDLSADFLRWARDIDVRLAANDFAVARDEPMPLPSLRTAPLPMLIRKPLRARDGSSGRSDGGGGGGGEGRKIKGNNDHGNWSNHLWSAAEHLASFVRFVSHTAQRLKSAFSSSALLLGREGLLGSEKDVDLLIGKSLAGRAAIVQEDQPGREREENATVFLPEGHDGGEEEEEQQKDEEGGGGGFFFQSIAGTGSSTSASSLRDFPHTNIKPSHRGVGMLRRWLTGSPSPPRSSSSSSSSSSSPSSSASSRCSTTPCKDGRGKQQQSHTPGSVQFAEAGSPPLSTVSSDDQGSIPSSASPPVSRSLATVSSVPPPASHHVSSNGSQPQPAPAGAQRNRTDPGHHEQTQQQLPVGPPGEIKYEPPARIGGGGDTSLSNEQSSGEEGGGGRGAANLSGEGGTMGDFYGSRSGMVRTEELNKLSVVLAAAFAFLFTLMIALFCICWCMKLKKTRLSGVSRSGSSPFSELKDKGGVFPIGGGMGEWQTLSVHPSPNTHLPPGHMFMGSPGMNGRVSYDARSLGSIASSLGPPAGQNNPSGWGTWYTYQDLHTATDGFDNKNVLGEGGYAVVYKGKLDDGSYAAVKYIRNTKGQAEREFRVEVDAISRVQHRHLVRLKGCCADDMHRVLVYEYISNGTLEDHLHKRKDGPALSWKTRIKIALGAAKGLAYLHEESDPKIIHRDVKSSNILLDDDFNAKMADFGLAKVMKDETSLVNTRIMGTFGYVAPEYASSGLLTEKSDIYSFGVLLLEMVCGRKPIDYHRPPLEVNLLSWVRLMNKRGMLANVLDPRLGRNNVPAESLQRVVNMALRCCDKEISNRPSMGLIARQMEVEMDYCNHPEAYASAEAAVQSNSVLSSGGCLLSPCYGSHTLHYLSGFPGLGLVPGASQAGRSSCGTPGGGAGGGAAGKKQGGGGENTPLTAVSLSGSASPHAKIRGENKFEKKTPEGALKKFRDVQRPPGKPPLASASLKPGMASQGCKHGVPVDEEPPAEVSVHQQQRRLCPSGGGEGGCLGASGSDGGLVRGGEMEMRQAVYFLSIHSWFCSCEHGVPVGDEPPAEGPGRVARGEGFWELMDSGWRAIL
ncbi:hypothetical protein CBR_g6417 [Chara braunii]|uniref:non-specific serine/threonine protein kinase n=1 Tax=Chara braunii TaxID=69332 RepID=A0A388KJR0_CHABU|nr:hypothetical protein CBR_g6417 [Chara braunii]|eukprot:GBG70290.1 hypothetical protein CBR_g6417 [Chara braunii]